MSNSFIQIEKTALVTGAARGIGQAIALRLAADGFAVLINFVQNEAAAQAVVKTIRDAGGRAQAQQGDVANPAEVETMFKAAQEAFGGVDVLVNNAGILHRNPLAEVNDADFARHMSINVTGTFNTLRAAATHLRDGGRIINLSSSIIGTYPANYGVYAATKSAVEALTRVAAKEFAAKGITVNAVAPGPTETELFYADSPKPMVEMMKTITPLKRLGTPKDIAAAVAFFAGPDSAWITGQVLRANGGLV